VSRGDIIYDWFAQAAAHAVMPTHVFLSKDKRNAMNTLDFDNWTARKTMSVSAACDTAQVVYTCHL